jgi:hypothetical protein
MSPWSAAIKSCRTAIDVYPAPSAAMDVTSYLLATDVASAAMDVTSAEMNVQPSAGCNGLQ